MELKVKNLVKGILMAGVTYASYGVIPILMISVVQQQIKQLGISVSIVSPLLLRYLIIVSLVLALFAFLREFFPTKTLAHAAAGLCTVFFSAVYLYLWAGGYLGEFGVFTINLTELNTIIQIGTYPLMRFILIVTLLNTAIYIIELTQIPRKKMKPKKFPTTYDYWAAE